MCPYMCSILIHIHMIKVWKLTCPAFDACLGMHEYTEALEMLEVYKTYKGTSYKGAYKGACLAFDACLGVHEYTEAFEMLEVICVCVYVYACMCMLIIQ